MPSTAAGAPRADRLGLLYQNILTGIVRIQSGKQTIPDVDTFRRRMKAALHQSEREAAAAGYEPAEVRDASFAVIALLDETLLSAKGPKSDEWQKRPLNIELFGQAIAGDVFFDKLLDLERRPDSTHLADLLEVYLTCLLLGFEGRFAPPLRGEAFRITERVRKRIELIRGTDYKISPPLELRPEPPRRAAATWPNPLWAAAIMLAVIVLLFVYYQTDLSARLSGLRMLVDSMR